MLKKTCIAGGMLIATAAGAAISSVPAFAEVPAWGGCCSSSHTSFFHHARNRNWNGNESENLNRIRLRIHNRNNNIAVARTERDERQRPIIVERDRGRGRDDAGLVGAPAPAPEAPDARTTDAAVTTASRLSP